MSYKIAYLLLLLWVVTASAYCYTVLSLRVRIYSTALNFDFYWADS